jgi:hypothetical protein
MCSYAIAVGVRAVVVRTGGVLLAPPERLLGVGLGDVGVVAQDAIQLRGAAFGEASDQKVRGTAQDTLPASAPAPAAPVTVPAGVPVRGVHTRSLLHPQHATIVYYIQRSGKPLH